MVDEAEDNADELEASEDEEEEGGKKKKKLSGRTLILFIVLPLIGVLGIGFGAMKMFGGGEEEVHDAEQIAEATPRRKDPAEVEFYDLKKILINIRTPDHRSTFLSLIISLELDKDQDTELLGMALPRIDDQFQVYLRELRLEDLTGAAGTQRVKEELLRRVNIAASPVKINAVLIREMVVQ